MNLQKLFAFFLVTAMAVLLITCSIFDTIAVIEDANAIQTDFTMVEAGGQFGNFLFTLMGFSDGWSIDLSKICKCQIKQLRNSTFSEQCLAAPLTVFAEPTVKMIPDRGKQNIVIWAYDAPGRRDLREYDRIRIDSLSIKRFFSSENGQKIN